EEILGRNCRFLQGEDTDQPALEEVREAARNGIGCRAVMRNYRKDGSMFWNELILSPVHDKRGKLTHYIGIQNDVTQQKEADKALRESQEYNRALFEQSPIGLALCEMSGELVDINSAYAAIIGRTVEETKALSYWEITPEKYAVQEQEQLQLLETTGHYGPYEKEYIHKDGHLVPVRLSGMLLEKRGKKYIWSSVEDISDIKQAESELQLAASVFNNADEAILITDAQNQIMRVNRTFSEITGYSAEEVVGKTPGLWRSHLHDDQFYKDMASALRGKGQWGGEIWNRRKSGEVFPVLQNISSIRDDKGEITQYISIFSDISAQKLSEQHIQHLAQYDVLTDLPNRNLFNERCNNAIKKAKRENNKVAVIVLDLDQFKHINDSFGHPVGDRLLQAVAKRFETLLREGDTLARFGGDEFAVLAEEFQDSGDAVNIVSKLLASLGESFRVQEQDMLLSASVGISLYPDDGDDVTSLVSNADAAMHQVKAQGR
ncbi:MAG: PAS domain S-box protein, partial [Gammaproteobacteria bacterium]|nr:PAS domain S-box protein [Gammaproteobacteria bacterium]